MTTLRNLQLGARALVIVLEVEALLIDSHQVMFEGYFENTNEIQMVTHLSDDIGHRFYLQDPLIHLEGNLHRYSTLTNFGISSCLSDQDSLRNLILCMNYVS